MPYTPPGYPIDTYPLLCQYDPKEEWLDKVAIERSTAGDAWGRALWPAKKKAYEITHKGLSFQEKTTLEAFYDTHRDKVFDARMAIAEAPGSASGVKRVLFTRPPALSFSASDRTWDAQVRLEEQ
jgi:hypothetical protein